MQYTRNELDFRRGTFRVRGDVIDIFPAEHAENAVRISLFDDEIETLHALRSADRPRACSGSRASPSIPSSHYVTPRADGAARDRGDQGRAARAHRVLPDAQSKLVEAQRIEQRTRFDLEMLTEIGFCKGIENYSRHLSGRKPGEPPPTLIDYLPRDALMFVDESHVTIPQVGGMYKGDRARKENLVDYGFRLPSALDNRPLRFDEFERLLPQTDLRLGDARRLRAQARRRRSSSRWCGRPASSIPQLDVRPASTQVDDLLSEISLRVEQAASACWSRR